MKKEHEIPLHYSGNVIVSVKKGAPKPESLAEKYALALIVVSTEVPNAVKVREFEVEYGKESWKSLAVENLGGTWQGGHPAKIGVDKYTVPVVFEGEVKVLAKENVSKKMATDFACATITVSSDNPDAPEDAASSEWMEECVDDASCDDEERLGKIWDATKIEKIEGKWAKPSCN